MLTSLNREYLGRPALESQHELQHSLAALLISEPPIASAGQGGLAAAILSYMWVRHTLIDDFAKRVGSVASRPVLSAEVYRIASVSGVVAGFSADLFMAGKDEATRYSL